MTKLKSDERDEFLRMIGAKARNARRALEADHDAVDYILDELDGINKLVSAALSLTKQ